MRSILLLLFFLLSTIAISQEICNNGIDDDADGKIDLNDPDCNCSTTAVTSIIPNPSFETFSSCPSHFSELSFATPWIQATLATTDYFNTCGFMIPPFTALGLQNFPNGNGIAGALFLRNWNEYLGATLLSPMVAGTNYQLTLNIAGLIINNDGTLSNNSISLLDPVNITLYGCFNGTNLPLNTIYNPNSYDATWKEIGNVTYTPVSTWGEVTITFNPNFNVNAIMLGPPKVLPPSYPTGDLDGDYPYFIFDNLLLNTAAAFGVNITQTGNFCESNLVLSLNLTAAVSPSVTFQWYHNGIAIIGATGINYAVPSIPANLGNYSVKITDGTTCFVSSKTTVNNTIPGPLYAVTQPTCITNTGIISIITSASEYSFNNGLTWQSSPISNPLPIGNYYIKIKSATGCLSSSIGVNIVEPQLLTSSDSVVTQPTTCGGTGSITITAPNAVEYSFDNGITWGSNPTATNLIPGSYLIKIKDALGCLSASQNIIINQIYLGYPYYDIIQPVCGTGGTITITTVGSEYSFDGGLTWSTNPVATNLPSGSYGIMVKSGTGCISYINYAYLYTFHLPNPNYTTVAPYCGNLGSITITTVASEYSFDGGSTWTTDPIATNLPSGSYSILIRNGVDCVSYYNYVYLYETFLPYPEYTKIQPSCGNGGTITITTMASEYSFDGGTTWTTNPISTNLPVGYYSLMVRNGSNCISYSSYVYLYETFLSRPDYTLIQPTCEINGSITITTPASEYSFDNGISWSSNPVFPISQGGYYQIKIKTSGGCISDSNYVYISSFYLQTPQITIQQPFCTETTGTISIESSNGYQYSFDNGMNYQNSNVSNPLSPGTYYIKVKKSNNCESRTEYVTIYSPSGIPSKPTGNTNQLFCVFNNPTIRFLIAVGQNISWYNSPLSTIPIPIETLLVNGMTYYATQTVAGCESPTRLSVTVTLSNYIIPATDYSTLVCDDLNDNIEYVDLTAYNLELIANPPDFNLTYFNTYLGAENNILSEKISNTTTYNLSLGLTKIYVRILASNGCYRVATLNLTLISSPFLTLIDSYIICENTSIYLYADLGYDEYLWSTGETSSSILINLAGNYWVKVTRYHGLVSCSTTKNILVHPSNKATISTIITTDWTDNDNVITVLLSNVSIGDYEYSLDGILYQDSNTFSNLETGNYIVYVRDKNNCGISIDEVFLLMYPKYFTPNNDTYQDTWKIKFSENEKELTIKIFDRNGKLLKQLGNNTGWDGIYNGNQLPASDYWFVVVRADGKEYRGHFSLKR